MYGVEKIGNVLCKNSKEIESSRFGIGLEKLDRDLYNPELCYDAVAEIGVKWVRIQSGWAKTEKSKGQYDFAWLDSIVDNLTERGTIPWMCLCYGNQLYTEGANNKTGGIGYPPIFSEDEKVAWRNYVKACVEHFKGRVEYFEVWNEPDGKWCWRHGPNGREYGEFAKDTAIVVKQANPLAKVLAGSFCGGDLSYLYEMMLAGLGEHIDYITYHNYKYDLEKGVEEFVTAMKSIISMFNPNIGIIQGETGAQSRYSTRGALNYSEWTERKQTKFLLRRMMIDLKTDVKFASYFTTVDIFENISDDSGTLTEDYYGFFGVLGETFENGKPMGRYYKKPAYKAFQCLCSLLSEDAKKTNLPICFRALPSRINGSNDEDAMSKLSNIYYQGFEKSNGAKAIVYWKATDIMTTEFSSTISMSCFGLSDKIQFIDMYDGTIYRFTEQMIEKNDNGEIRLLHVPINDYPVMITFGDFYKIK